MSTLDGIADLNDARNGRQFKRLYLAGPRCQYQSIYPLNYRSYRDVFRLADRDRPCALVPSLPVHRTALPAQPDPHAPRPVERGFRYW